MNSLSTHLRELRASGRKVLAPFFTAGFPDSAAFFDLLAAAGASGADVIEVGLPFSDPLADGPAIQLSSQRALAAGFELREFLTALERGPLARNGARPSGPQSDRDGRAPADGTSALQKPLVAMTYVNPVLSYGPRFAADLAAAGFSGVIFPDLPLGEDAGLAAAVQDAGLDLIRLVAPTTPARRLARIAREAQGFIYLVSTTGVTGERQALPPELAQLVARVRGATDLPVLVGFGIGTPEQAAEAAALADGVIVGSALMRLVAEAKSSQEAVANVSGLLHAMRKAIDNVAVQGAST